MTTPRPTPLEKYLAQAVAHHGRHSEWCANRQRLHGGVDCVCGYKEALATAEMVVEMVTRYGVADDDT